MGGFEAALLGAVDPSVKYHSVNGHVLICTAKTYGDSIWRVVLLGRHPPKK